MSAIDTRELFQLITAGAYYFGLAEKEKPNLINSQLDSKIVEYLFKNKDDIKSDEDKFLFIFSSHLASAAIRLNSIEDHLKNAGHQTKERENYQKLKNIQDENGRSKMIDLLMERAIHIFFRQIVSHSESEYKNKPAYQHMQEKFNILTHRMTYEYMKKSIINLEKLLTEKYNVEKAVLN